MEYIETKPYKELEPFIHSYLELKGEDSDRQWERNFPDGCAGLVMNIGETCLTNNGSLSMEFGKTYVVGAMTSFKDSFINSNTHLLGVCLKPATFTNFYNYVAQDELTDNTIEFEKPNSFNIDKNNKPIGPPTNLPATKGLTELKSTLFRSLINTRIANGRPNRDKS